MDSQYIIRFDHVSKKYKNTNTSAVNDLSVGIMPGEFVTILGSSGSGKTTILKMVNRIIEPTEGTIFFKDSDIMSLDADKLRQQIGYVIQQIGLFPHMTVEDNISLLPDCLKRDKVKTRKKAHELLNLVRLDPNEYKDRYPKQLSGGQQQRVSIARALISDPDVLLLDEPFGAIDVINRLELQDELISIHKQFKKTILFVTHDVQEAMKLGTKVMVINDGMLQQYNTPSKVILNKDNQYVADIVGNKGELSRIMMLKPQDIARKYQAGDAGVYLDTSADMAQVINVFMSDKSADSVVLTEKSLPKLTLFRDDITI